jgi:hypothetical protein
MSLIISLIISFIISFFSIPWILCLAMDHPLGLDRSPTHPHVQSAPTKLLRLTATTSAPPSSLSQFGSELSEGTLEELPQDEMPVLFKMLTAYAKLPEGNRPFPMYLRYVPDTLKVWGEGAPGPLRPVVTLRPPALRDREEAR